MGGKNCQQFYLEVIRIMSLPEGHTYFVSSADVTWDVAKSTAESLGGYLLVVNSTHEWGWMQEQEPEGALEPSRRRVKTAGRQLKKGK